ncbi:MAG: response regulator [Nitrospirota bacterium]
MFKVLIADDDYEDRELLKLEIQQALSSLKTKITFYEASSVKTARELLRTNTIDLLTLDIQFDRLSEGIDALPEIFEKYPTLTIIVISGKLNKNEVAEQLFRFTKDNVLKSKRWARHFDVLDKKDDKKEALQRAFSFAFKKKEAADNVRDLFVLAESYLEKEEMDKCIEVYKKIQDLAPGEQESRENIKLLSSPVSPGRIFQYMRTGDKIAAALLFGHYIEIRLKAFTSKHVGRAFTNLSDCLKELERSRRLSPLKAGLFGKMMRLRNRAIHRPADITEKGVQAALESIKKLEGK